MKYHVHAYVTVRVTARDIEAESQTEAIAKFDDACEPGLAQRFDRGDDQGYAEEITGYLVDEAEEAGDGEYGRSRAYLCDGVTMALPGNAKPPTPVFVVVYEHRHGMDVSAHASHGQAYAAVAEIARTWWKERADRSAPEDCSTLSDEEAVNAYFEGHEEDFYTIEDLKIVLPG